MHQAKRSYRVVDELIDSDEDEDGVVDEGVFVGKAAGYYSGGGFHGVAPGCTIEKTSGERGIVLATTEGASLVGWEKPWVSQCHVDVCRVVQGDTDSPFPSNIDIRSEVPHPYAVRLRFPGEKAVWVVDPTVTTPITAVLEVPPSCPTGGLSLTVGDIPIPIPPSEQFTDRKTTISIPVPPSLGRYDVILSFFGYQTCVGVIAVFHKMHSLHDHDDGDHRSYVFTDIVLCKEVPKDPSGGSVASPERWGEIQDWSRGYNECGCALRAKQMLLEGDGVSQKRSETKEGKTGVPEHVDETLKNLSLDAIVSSVSSVYRKMYSHVLQRKYLQALDEIEVYHVKNCGVEPWWLADSALKRERLAPLIGSSTGTTPPHDQLSDIFNTADLTWPILLSPTFTPADLDAVSFKALLPSAARSKPPSITSLIRSGKYPHFSDPGKHSVLEARYLSACKWVAAHMLGPADPHPLERFEKEVLPCLEKCFGVSKQEGVQLLADKLLVGDQLERPYTVEGVRKWFEGLEWGGGGTRVEARRAKELLAQGLIREIQIEVPVSRPLEAVGWVKGREVKVVVECGNRSKSDVKRDCELLSQFLLLASDTGDLPPNASFTITRSLVTVHTSSAAYITVLHLTPTTTPQIIASCVCAMGTQTIPLPPDCAATTISATTLIITPHPILFKPTMPLWHKNVGFGRRSEVFDRTH